MHDPKKDGPSKAFRHVMREYAQYLSGNELAVLLFIVDRTYSYGKHAEVIPARHFLEGVWSGDECIHGPLNMVGKTLTDCLKSLREKGYIVAQRKGNTPTAYYVELGLRPSNVVRLPPRRKRKRNTGRK